MSSRVKKCCHCFISLEGTTNGLLPAPAAAATLPGFVGNLTPAKVARSFPKVSAQNIRAFGNSEGALQRVNLFLEGGQEDPSALFFFADKGNSGLRYFTAPRLLQLRGEMPEAWHMAGPQNCGNTFRT